MDVGEVPIGDFGTIVFITDSVTTMVDGTTVTPAGATIYDINQGGADMTSSTLSHGGVTVVWASAARGMAYHQYIYTRYAKPKLDLWTMPTIPK